jgi:GNAT superfamily N-acetyltransferase
VVSEDIAEIRERFKRAGIGLKDALAVIDMTLQDQLTQLPGLTPYEVFRGLNKLIDRTVHGTKIGRFRPQEGSQPFHAFEIHTEGGDVIGYLNMIYLRKPIPCYYLVYVEVLPSFRGRGLGNKILKAFREFSDDRKAVGLLDNIIPPDDPTYGIYTGLGWKSIGEYIGHGMANREGKYMVFVPASIKTPELGNKLIKLLFNLKKKRPVLDMHDNEDMVKRTIEEFQSVYEALVRLFDRELSSGTSTPLMRFMFTRFTTKLIGFRRRIACLLGYTGGESLDQISISEQIRELSIQPYSLWNLKEDKAEIRGDEGILRNLPGSLKEEPTLFIEDLLLYMRPYLSSWMEKRENRGSLDMKISDLLDLGFDPTKLREFRHEGVGYIFERLSPHLFSSLEDKRRCLIKIAECTSRTRIRGASIGINPPLVIFRDRGNVYVLRRKVEGIHSEEALDQLRTSSYLKEMNRAAGIDRAIVRTINDVKEWLVTRLDSSFREEIEELAYFVPWDVERNIPKIPVDISGVSLDTIWIA